MNKCILLTMLAVANIISIEKLHAEDMSQNFLSDIYIFGKGAYTTSDYNKSDLGSFNGQYLDITDTGFSYGFGVGYNLTENWHAEVGYLNLYDSQIVAAVPAGTSVENVESIAPIESGDGLTLQLGYRYFLSPDWTLSVRAGAFFWDADTNHEVVAIENKSGSDNNTSLYYSAGLEYIINSSWSLETMIDRVEFKESPATLFGLKVNYRFGNSQRTVYTVDGLSVAEEPQEEVAVNESSGIFRRWEHHSDSFDTNSFELKTDNLPWFIELVEVMEAYPQAKVEIVGHTDDSGASDYNLGLSEKRAQAVEKKLLEVGINSERIIAYGVGESAPKYPNSTIEGRKKNRRVEIMIPKFEYAVE
ncbi:membrane protein [Vibrio zhanjiangensis]|uniref:Membrane protein n=1 Tax=Vibrio zhanjiangensis TaxID=1046128 RepID=A0ABQ6EU78_9VIBR|nr:OmpA family protein [Vibrio zhanjiangensis]GLT16261.1 membrane protein [Vibrio zhanjiangensis]